ncbi:VanZ family protein [Vibrio scophthalmi]|uniref:VanZ family protein n=1 Tax=Vibrio scophthalmi TaxID=45658 RepID=UPI00080B479F|nr:VanZ family protein [Vibrio scophthalmi]
MNKRPLYFNRRVVLLMVVVLLGGLASMAKTFNVHGNSVREVEVLLGGDWALHSILSFLLGFIACWATPKYYFRNALFRFPPLLILMFCLVSVDEAFQAVSPLREFSWQDFLINISGLLLGSAVYRLYLVTKSN